MILKLLHHLYLVKEKINLSLPSLRVDNFSEELLQKVSRVRKSGLTFAPEAGKMAALLTFGYPARIPKAPARKEGRYIIL